MSPLAADHDAAVWQQVRQGDEAAFGRLYREHAPALFRFALRLTGSRAVAEDVVQDVFVGLIDAATRPPGAGYDPARGPLRSYLYGAVRNAAHKRLREGPVARADVEAIRIGQRTDDDRQAVTAALLQLEPDFREVVILCEVEGLQYEEAAAALDIPVGTVRSRLFRARARLAAALSDEPTNTDDQDDVRENVREDVRKEAR
jgi:RNA polymerase sigma-70 factor (ECF subfamily)